MAVMIACQEPASSFRVRVTPVIPTSPALLLSSFSAITTSCHLVSVRGLAPVANDLESAEHLTNGEETNHLSGDNADLLESGRVHVPYAVEERLGILRCRRAVDEG